MFSCRCRLSLLPWDTGHLPGSPDAVTASGGSSTLHSPVSGWPPSTSQCLWGDFMWLFRSPFIAVLQMGNLQAQFGAQFGAFHGIWYELVVPPSATDCALSLPTRACMTPLSPLVHQQFPQLLQAAVLLLLGKGPASTSHRLHIRAGFPPMSPSTST